MRSKILDNLAVLECARERGDMMEKEKRNATQDSADFLFSGFAKAEIEGSKSEFMIKVVCGRVVEVVTTFNGFVNLVYIILIPL